MYSPKIADNLVHALYFVAKDRKIPMTRLVNAIIREALASNNLPKAGTVIQNCGVRSIPHAEPQNAVA